MEYKRKAALLEEWFSKMQNITCTPIEGSMYGFPQVHFSEKFINEAKAQGKEPDFLYCMDMVNETGIITIPGSGFKQKEGTYHFRITNLVTPYEKMERTMEALDKFNTRWHAKH
jgi:alanine transaminase